MEEIQKRGSMTGVSSDPWLIVRIWHALPSWELTPLSSISALRVRRGGWVGFDRGLPRILY